MKRTLKNGEIMLNLYRLLIIFNKQKRFGASRGNGYNISANGSDIGPTSIVSHGARFIELAPNSFELMVVGSRAMLRDIKHRDYIINQDDVDMIREVETNKIIWISPKVKQIIIELDPISRPRPTLTRMTNGGPIIIYLDRNNCVPYLWTDGLDLKNFPLFIKLHAGIIFSEKDVDWLEFEFIGDVCPIEKFYILRVYEKNGGKIFWQKP